MRGLKWWVKCAAGFGAMLMMAGCISVLPEAKAPDAAYLIAAPSQPGSSARLVVRVAVLEPDAVRLMGGRQILFRGRDGGLRLVPEVQWAETATLMLQRALADTLQDAAGPGGFAQAGSAGGGEGVEVDWHIDLMVVEADRALTVANVTLRDAQTRTPLTQRRFERAVAIGKGDSEIAALSASASALVRDIADFVLDTLSVRAGTAVP
jgi:cholesterol transport system auxiliary component